MKMSHAKKIIKKETRKLKMLDVLGLVLSLIGEFIVAYRVGEMCKEISNDGDFFSIVILACLSSFLLFYICYYELSNSYRSKIKLVIDKNKMIIEEEKENEHLEKEMIERHIKFDKIMNMLKSV